MKKRFLAASIALAAVAGLGLAPLAAQAQNIAVVNGKPVPKARADAVVAQVQKQAAARGQQLPPDLDKLVRDKVVTDEILVQEAERRGLGASNDYKQQMEIARQSILIGLLAADVDKKATVTDAEVQAEYDKFKAQASGTEYRVRHILVEKEDEAKAIVAQLKAGAKFEDLAKKNSKDPGSAENGGDLDFANAGAYVPEFSQAMTKLTKGELHRRAGEDPVRLSHHPARGHARSEVPAPGRSQAADPAAPRRSRRRPRSATTCAPRRRPTTSSPTEAGAGALRARTVGRRLAQARIRPASIVKRRSQRPAMPRSCVTSTSVVPGLAVQVEHQRHHRLAGGEVEAAGRLVGQQHAPAGRRRPAPAPRAAARRPTAPRG